MIRRRRFKKLRKLQNALDVHDLDLESKGFLIQVIFMDKKIESLDDLFKIDDLLSEIDCGEWFWENKEEFCNHIKSGVIKEEIKNCVERTDLKKLYQIYDFDLFESLNQKDLKYIFNHDGLNLIQFLLENFDKISKIESEYAFFEYEHDVNLSKFGALIKSEEISNYISKIITHILQNYKIKEYMIPLFNLGLLDLLSKEDIQYLIDNPDFDFLDLLIKQSKAFEDYSGVQYVKETLKKYNINFKELANSLLKKEDLGIYVKIWNHNLWDIFEIDDIRELIDDNELNFLENLLKAAHKVYLSYVPLLRKNCEHQSNVPLVYDSSSKIIWEGDYYNSILYLLPLIDELVDLIKVKIIKFIKKKEMDTFVPLYASGIIFYFNDEEILSLVNDSDINLLKLVLTVLDKHSSELDFYLSWENLNKNIGKFFGIIRIFEPSVILKVIETLEDINFSPLMKYEIIEELNYEELTPLFLKNRNFFKAFLKSLESFTENTRRRASLGYYKNLVPSLLLQKLNDFKLYTEIGPYTLIVLNIFECYGVQFTVSLLNQADIAYMRELFELLDLKSDFFHLLGNYLTGSIKNKILSVLKDADIEIIYKFLYLRWNLFFNEDEVNELREVLKNSNVLDSINKKFYKKYGLEHYATYILLSFYSLIDKHNVIKLLESFSCKRILRFFLKSFLVLDQNDSFDPIIIQLVKQLGNSDFKEIFRENIPNTTKKGKFIILLYIIDNKLYEYLDTDDLVMLLGNPKLNLIENFEFIKTTYERDRYLTFIKWLHENTEIIGERLSEVGRKQLNYLKGL